MIAHLVNRVNGLHDPVLQQLEVTQLCLDLFWTQALWKFLSHRTCVFVNASNDKRKEEEKKLDWNNIKAEKCVLSFKDISFEEKE